MIYRISSINSIFRLVKISRYFFGSGSNGEMEIEFIEFYKKALLFFRACDVFWKFREVSDLLKIVPAVDSLM